MITEVLVNSGATVALIREHMVTTCLNKVIYQGLLDKHQANRRHRTDNEKEGWKTKSAQRKKQRAKAREWSESEEDLSEPENVPRKGKGVKKSAPSSLFDRFNKEQRISRASDLVETVLSKGGGDLLNFIEAVSPVSLSIPTAN